MCVSQDGRDAKAVDKALELIGEWKMAFGSQSGYKAVHDIFGELEREGYHIPETEVASAAFIKKVSPAIVLVGFSVTHLTFNLYRLQSG